MPVSTLEHTQRAMMQALDLGPDYLPREMFAGSPARIIAGMKVHANTISHARLVALEDTFPRVMALLGHAAFNHLSREYLARPEAGGVPHADIGRDFAEFLAGDEEVATGAALARFEWHWLESFRAAEAQPLQLADLAAFAPEDLPRVELVAHPAARLTPADSHVCETIGDQLPDLAQAGWLLLVRPEEQVRLVPATAAMRAILGAAQFPAPIGNLLAICNELPGSKGSSPDAAMPALIALIEAGALLEVRE